MNGDIHIGHRERNVLTTMCGIPIALCLWIWHPDDSYYADGHRFQEVTCEACLLLLFQERACDT